MRFCRMLAVAAIAVLATVGANVAKADGAPGDPVVSIHKCTTGCDLGSFDNSNSESNPLIVTDLGATTNFVYCPTDITDSDCTGGIAEVYVEVVPQEGESAAQFNSEKFSCVAGLAATCSTVGPMEIPAVEFVFDGTCIQNCAPDSDAPPVYANFLSAGDIVGVSVPEPNGIALLLVGLVALLAFGVRRREVPVF
jgi:hypothetical protein